MGVFDIDGFDDVRFALDIHRPTRVSINLNLVLGARQMRTLEEVNNRDA